MKVSRFPHLVAASAVLIAGVGCQTAHKPSSRVVTPPRTPPPVQQSREADEKAVAAKAPPIEDTAPRNGAPSTPALAAKPETMVAPDPVAELVARVEKEYHAGVEQYRAGQRDAAR